MTRPVIQLHRPWAPDPLAESVQVLAAAHGLARHRPVQVLMRRRRPVSTAEVLRRHGHAPRPGLRLRLLPQRGSLASVGFWAAVTAWFARHPGGVALARTARYGRSLARLQPRARLVAEVHGLTDPLLPSLLAGSVAAVCNSVGTAAGVRRLAPTLPVVVCANAARGPGPTLDGEGRGIGYVGSVRAGKGLEVLAELAASQPVVWVTPDIEAARALGPHHHLEPALDPADVPARLARFRCIVVPLAPGPFGEVETCPLKLFDALASGRPVVVADAPTLHPGIVPAWVPRYRMGDAADLAAKIDVAISLADRFARRPALRTWDDRGDELHAFLEAVCP